jgi:hypothetical protein
MEDKQIQIEINAIVYKCPNPECKMEASIIIFKNNDWGFLGSKERLPICPFCGKTKMV